MSMALAGTCPPVAPLSRCVARNLRSAALLQKGPAMRNDRFRRPPFLLIVVALVLITSGCSGQPAHNAPTSSPSTSSPSPTAPTVSPSAARPLTVQERAWLQAIATLHQRFDKEFHKDANVTKSKLRSWETLMRSCRKELTRIGTPSARLQPVQKLVQQACREYDKGAACYAVSRRYLNSYSATAHKKVEQSLDCGINAE